ncbi:MAG: hypothetical protein H7A25_15160 [Leptospiraceae bacterium]|nr:hypothetical protein [Leptospiraceae bacterium]MCP5501238.1 hypothetical protein [Leptospiraceae bacterium]
MNYSKIVAILIFALLFSPSLFSKGESRFRLHEKGTIRGTEINPVTKGVEDLVHRLNIAWAGIMSKKQNIDNFSGLMTDIDDLTRYRELEQAFKLDEITYKTLLKDLSVKLKNTFSKVDDKDIFERLKHLKKYETKDNFIFMSKISEWQKDYEEREVKKKEIVSEPNEKIKDDSNPNTKGSGPGPD